MCDLHHHGCIKSNNANKFIQCYGRTFYSKLHAFAKKDGRRYVNTLKLGPSLAAKKKSKRPDPRAKVLDQTSH